MASFLGKIFGKKNQNSSESYQEIISQIKKSLTGDWEHDSRLLNECSNQYKDHPQGIELVKAITRLLYDVMPQDKKEAFAKVYDDDMKRLENVLLEVQNKVNAHMIDEAESLLVEAKLTEGFSDDLFREDNEAVYLSFKNPLEREFYRAKFKPTKTLREPGGLPFDLSFHLAAYIAFERQDYDKCLKIIEKGLKRCPFSTDLLFERSEIFKIRKQWTEYRAATEAALPALYTRPDIARFFRNMGYYFIESGLWEPALCCYSVSRYWQHIEACDQELSYIVHASQMKFEDADALANDFERCQQILAKHSVPIYPIDPLWLQLSVALGDLAKNNRDFMEALQFYSVNHEITGDSQIQAAITECCAELNSECAVAYMRADGVLRVSRIARTQGYIHYASANFSPGAAGYRETVDALNLSAGQTKEMSAWYTADQGNSMLRSFVFCQYDPNTKQPSVIVNAKYTFPTSNGFSEVMLQNDDVESSTQIALCYAWDSIKGLSEDKDLAEAYNFDLSKMSDNVKERLMLYVRPRPGILQDLVGLFGCVQANTEAFDREYKQLVKTHFAKTMATIENKMAQYGS